jgi:hypothetical protein
MKRRVTHDGYIVSRPAYANAAFVRDVLRHLEAQGFDGAPRALGLDDVRETLSFVPGSVHDEPSLSEAQVASAGRLLRRLHDALAGCPLAGDGEIVCHGDAGLHNVVFRGDDAVAFIDWEQAEPGTRLTELAVFAWCLLDNRWQREPPAPAARRIGVFCRAYGWDDSDLVFDHLTVLVGRARDEHAELGIAESVSHFEQLGAWLEVHASTLRSEARQV